MMDGDQSGMTSFSSSSPEVSTSGFGGFLPIAIGLAGVLLGGIALFFSFTGSGKVGQTESSITTLQNQIQGFEDKVRELESALERVNNQYSALDSRLRSTGSHTQNGFNQLGAEITHTRRQVTEYGERIAELTETLNKMRTGTVAVPDTRSAEAGEGERTATGGQQIHTIVSGDTFTTLARRYGVSIDAIMAANPDADPRRLRVGQQITIPSPQ